jgi:hypothetical protein
MATLICLVIYVIKTWEIASATRTSTETSQQMLEEMKATRDQEVAPYVVAYFDVEKKPNLLPIIVFFTIKNEGKTAAKNVKLEFDPPLPTLAYAPKPRNLNELSMIKDGIPVMPPGFKIRTTFGFYTVLAEKGMSYRLKISFDGANKPEHTEYILDLSPFSDLLYDAPQEMPQLIEQVKKTHESIDKIKEKFSLLVDRIDDGLWIKNSRAEMWRTSFSLEEWKAAIHSKLIEYKLLWTSIYGIDFEKLNDDLFFSNLKNYYMQTGEYLLQLVSLAPASIPQGIKEKLISLSSKLMEVESPKFIVREKDLDEFGNTFVALTEQILTELSEYDSSMSD